VTYNKLIINTLFASTFFNHLHALSFIPQHNRPLLLLLFPLVVIYYYRYNIGINIKIILWFIVFFTITIFSLLYNIFFGGSELYYPEVINRLISYLVIFYFFLIGTLFYLEKNKISDFFYTFLIFIGIIQVYYFFGLPYSENIGLIFSNYLIESFASGGKQLLFLEAEPSYVAYFIIFIMVFYENKRKYPWLFLSFFTLSIRSTFVSVAYYLKRKPVLYGFSILLMCYYLFTTFNISSYTVYTRAKNIITFQTLDPSSYIRVVKNQIALDIVKDYPILGVGPGQYSNYYTSNYLNNYDTRMIEELEGALKRKSKTEDPYSFLLGMFSEIGILGLGWFLFGFYFLLKNSNRKYLFLIIFIILMWDYPYGKPFIWLLFGYIFQENFINQKKLI
tara:strand:- start:21193 stop:22365 length:1173 start_codon:yes stop_codon:yes gene_type:complete